MLPDEKIGCHRLVRKCRAGVVDDYCQLWVSVKFRNPHTGEMVDKYGCADSFLHLIAIEGAQMSAQTGAAIESFRNEVVKANEQAVQERQATVAEVSRHLRLRQETAT
jgi:predicted Ser/Thr protein kinase